MVKVKLLVSRSGADGSHSPGDEIEVSAAEAKRMLDAGQIAAIAAPVERAVLPRKNAK